MCVCVIKLRSSVLATGALTYSLSYLDQSLSVSQWQTFKLYAYIVWFENNIVSPFNLVSHDKVLWGLHV